MNQFIKQFFGPTWKSAIIKIVVGFLLFTAVDIIYALKRQLEFVADYNTSGWPLQYFWATGLNDQGSAPHGYYPLALIFDIVFWYLILCLIIFLYKKAKEKTAV